MSDSSQSSPVPRAILWLAFVILAGILLTAWLYDLFFPPLATFVPPPHPPVPLLANRPDLAETVGRIVRTELQDGTVAFEAPEEMQVGVSQSVAAAIAFGIDADTYDDLALTIEEAIGATEVEPEFRPVVLSDSVRMRLLADSEKEFVITPQSPLDQTLIVGVIPQWRWRVTPLAAGQDKVLTLSVDALIHTYDAATGMGYVDPVTIRVLEERIDVRINPAHSARIFLSTNWRFMTALLLLFVATLLLRSYRQDRRSSVGSQTAHPLSAHHEAFQQALLSAFGSTDELRQMVQFGLDQNLNAITEADSLTEVTFALIRWADRNGQLDVLVQAAYRQNPGNPKLRNYVQMYAPELLEAK